MGLFDNMGEAGSLGYGAVVGDELMKSLQAGYGTDSANMTGGRALIPQDIDQGVLNALTAKKQDFKLMNLLKTRKTGSSVLEYTRRNDAGQYGLIFGKEGGDARASEQTLERVTRLVKYMQTYRELTLQMRVADTLENAEASEKEAGILTILKGAEWGSFHGDGDAVPEQFDNVVKQILSAVSPNGYKNLVDLRGKTMQDAGENALTEVARMTFQNGGNLTHSFMPPVIAADLQAVVRDRVRFNVTDQKGSPVVMNYPTAFSDDIIIAGRDGGADKMFFPRDAVAAVGDAAKRPGAPSISGAANANAASKFLAGDAGDYTYAVHAISEEGISAASTVATVTVAAGASVTLTITPDGSIPGTGFIITRGKKGVTTGLKEVARIAKASTATTTFVDHNDVLPGTGDVLLVSHDTVQATMRWAQFLPAMKFDLFPTKSAIIPFLIVMFGTPDVMTPWYHGVIRNVSPSDLGWY